MYKLVWRLLSSLLMESWWKYCMSKNEFSKSKTKTIKQAQWTKCQPEAADRGSYLSQVNVPQ